MKILTICLTTDDGTFAERLELLGKVVKSKRPEFIAIQNVNNEVIKKIQATTWGSKYNATFPPTKYEMRLKPQVALLSTYPTYQTSTHNYIRTPGHKLLLTATYIMFDKAKNPHLLSVNTTQLEVGTQQSELREIQMNEILLSLASSEDSIVLGDFSLLPVDGQVSIHGGWSDTWLAVSGNTEEDGATYVPARNPLIKNKDEPTGRPDRIFAKLRRYKLESVEVVGNEDGAPISGHYGVLASFAQTDVPLPITTEEPVVCIFNRS